MIDHHEPLGPLEPLRSDERSYVCVYHMRPVHALTTTRGPHEILPTSIIDELKRDLLAVKNNIIASANSVCRLGRIEYALGLNL